MISVLLLIFKVIGIALIAILGIILFLVCLILFVTVRYSVKETIYNNISAEGKIRWFFSALGYDFSFQENEFNGNVRIFGIRQKKRSKDSDETSDVEEEESGIAEAEPKEEVTKEVKKSEDTDISSKVPLEVKSQKETSHSHHFSLISALKKKLRAIYDRICHGKEFAHKINEMIHDPVNQYAARKIWAELLYLLKHFGFRKIDTKLTFSLADPALTGQVLGILCMLPFLYKYEFHIYPDFESERIYISGTYDIRGKIRLIHLLAVVIRLLVNKQTRTFLKRIVERR